MLIYGRGECKSDFISAYFVVIGALFDQDKLLGVLNHFYILRTLTWVKLFHQDLR